MKNIDVDFAQKHRPEGFVSCPALGLPFKLYDLYDAQTTDYRWAFLAYWLPSFLGTEEMKTLKDEALTKGRRYVWLNYSYAAVQLYSFGIRSDRAVASLVNFLASPPAGLPPLVDKLCVKDPERGKSMVFLSKTPALDMLCGNTHAVDLKLFASYGIEDCSEYESESPSGEVSQPPEKPIELFTFPDWWGHFWEEVSATGKYKDKIYKDKEHTVVNGYVQKTIKTINSILDGTYYNKGSYGEHHDVKYDLSTVTIDSIIDAMKKYNVKEQVTMDEVVCTFSGKGKNSRKSRFISLVCVGTEWPKDNTPVKLSKNPRIQPDKYRPELKDPTPSFVWAEGYSSVQNTPDRHYPEFSIDNPMFWGLYREVQEYHEACTVPDGIWLHNNTSGKPPVSVLKIVMAMLEAAKDAGISYAELIREVKVGVDKNWIWALTIQKVFTAQNSYKIGRGVTGDLYKHLYNAWPLAKEYYKE